MSQREPTVLIDSCSQYNRSRLETFAYLLNRKLPIHSIKLDDGTDLPGKPMRHNGVRFEVHFDVDGKLYAYPGEISYTVMFGGDDDWASAFDWIVGKVNAFKANVVGGD